LPVRLESAASDKSCFSVSRGAPDCRNKVQSCAKRKIATLLFFSICGNSRDPFFNRGHRRIVLLPSRPGNESADEFSPSTITSRTLPIELGAEFIHSRPKATWNLLQKANLTAYQVPFDNYEVRGGRIVEAPRFSDQLNRTMKGLIRLKERDISFAAYSRDRCTAKKLGHARKLAEYFVEGFDAADLELVSSKSLAEEPRRCRHDIRALVFANPLVARLLVIASVV